MDQKLQLNFETIRVYDEKDAPPEVTKIGVLPFMTAPVLHDWRVLLMKPVAESKHLGEPAFQLAKGTRRLFMNERWCDMREDDLRYADPCFYERMVDTALREGAEEVGLKPSNIRRLFDMGGFTFISASRGLRKPLRMFAAEMSEERDFNSFERSTAETRWFRFSEIGESGRPDHIEIAQKIVERMHKKTQIR